VLGLLAFLYLVSTTLVLCAEMNVVLAEQLYPRALLSAFSDDAELTVADRRIYTKRAKAERVKRLERVIVRFNDVNRPVTP
jgi:membrane protein